MANTNAPQIRELAKVWTPEAEWDVQTAHGKSTFMFPAFGLTIYKEAVKQALASGQRLPNGEQCAFMLDEAYHSEDKGVKSSPRTKFVREDIMYNGWLWVPNVNIWTPVSDKNAGLYVVHDEKGQGLSREYTIEELEDILNSAGGSTEKGVRFSKDRKVAFASSNLIKGFGKGDDAYLTRDHEKGTLHEDGAFLANYDIEGAQKLDNVGEGFTFDPRSWIVVNKTGKPVQTLSALSRYRYDGGLWADFGAYDDDGNGYVLPVSGSGNSAEGTAPQN